MHLRRPSQRPPDRRLLAAVVAAALAAAGLGAPSAAVAQSAATTPFSSTYQGYDVNTGSCSRSMAVQGSEPAAAGRYPVFVYVHGSLAESTNEEGRRVAQLAAAHGFVAAAPSYDSSLSNYWLPLMDGHSRCVFTPWSSASTLARVCGRPKADCSRGVVVSGFSQGGVIAMRARNHTGLVRAAWVMGVTGPVEAGTIASPGGTRALANSRLRIAAGAADVSSVNPLNWLTGQLCGASPCIRADGSGYHVVQHAQVTDGYADHCYWQDATMSWPYWSCASSPPFDPLFRPPSTASWSLTTGLNWLRTKLG